MSQPLEPLNTLAIPGSNTPTPSATTPRPSDGSTNLEQNTNLADGVWANANYDFVVGAPGSAGSGFGTVTNRIITTVEDAQLLRLVIETSD